LAVHRASLPAYSTTDQDFGRGLYLLEALADAWGRYPVAGQSRMLGWKVVWFELSTGRDPVSGRS
jgi:hypothetical protein